jgi:titin
VALGNTLDGVGIHSGASDNRVGGYGGNLSRNVISGNRQDGVNVAESGTSDNVIEGNYIGTNAAGTAALGNGLVGVGISQGASGNAVGGVVAAARNVISGNLLDGVSIFGFGTTANAVAGNYIGTNAAGNRALGNGGDGVFLGASASGNVIGGTTTGVRNVISGNRHDGVVVRDVGTTANAVAGNYIGTNATGSAALGNLLDGVEVFGGASNNVLGGLPAGGRNVISGNRRAGINIHDQGTDFNAVSANYIGTDARGRVSVGNGHDGVDVSSSAHGNLVGGQEVGEGNLISGNKGFGLAIFAFATGNLVEGNYIGTNAAGTAALANRLFGVDIRDSASGNVIGGTTAATRNLVSGNAGDGLDITGSNSTGNVVEGTLKGRSWW